MANLLRKLTIGSTEYPIQVGIHYGTCTTAAGTAAKVVTLTDPTGFELVTGAIIAVKFTNSNSAGSPTLNVNSTGAKSIMRYGTTPVSTDTTTTGWIAGAVQIFVYDGTNWIRDYWNNPTISPTIENPNLLVNGDFQIWQRGESFNFNSATLNTSFYTADRWYTTHSESYGGTSSIEKTSDGMYLNLNDTTIQFRQVTEIPYSSGDEYTLQISINNSISTITLTAGGGAQTFYPGYDSSIKTELVESNSSSTIALHLEISAYSTFTINWIKLERGSSATPFTPNSYEQELAVCKRYYQEIESLGPFLNTYLSESTTYTTLQVYIQFDTMVYAPSEPSEIEVLYPTSSDLEAVGTEVISPMTKNGFVASITFNRPVPITSYHAAIIKTTLDTEFDA